MKGKHQEHLRLIPCLTLGFSLVLLFTYLTSFAQTVPPITSSGLNTRVSPSSTLPSGKVQYDITGGTRPGGGANLFHSFGEFGVPNNNIANFLNDSGLATSNILGRVTGGNISNIFGAIQTQGFGSANLFLMNPTGFLFGPNATVNVGGMVSFTSADYLRLTDNARFTAVPGPADALLTAAPVAAFGFLGSNPGAITVQGSQLSVTPGQSISLVGGNITVQSGVLDDGVTIQPARLAAPGGQINLASVASPGEILLPSLQAAPNVNGKSFTAMGNISLSEGAFLDVSADGAGTVHIRGEQLVVDSATISADTVNSNGAPVAIDINVANDVSISTLDVPALTARTTGSGNSGDIRISSQNMDMTATAPNNFQVSVIDTHTSASGNAGNVNITAANNLALTGDPNLFVVAIDSGTGGGGHGGNVTLTAKTISLVSASIYTGNTLAQLFGGDDSGSGGNLSITADSFKVATFSQMATDGGGQAGDMTITARDVQLIDNIGLSTSGFEKGGPMRITADNLLIDSSHLEANTVAVSSGGITIGGRVVDLTNGSTLRTATFGNGNAGDIKITATDHLTLADDPSTLGAETRPSGLFTNSFGNFGHLGNAGAITITTPSLAISGGARIETSTRSSGHGGDVTINADSISMQGERPTEPIEGIFVALGSSRASGIFTRTVGNRFCTGACGDAGNVFITTGTISIGEGAQLNSGTISTGHGGGIVVSATGPIAISGTMIDGTPGGILSQAAGTVPMAGAGGNITLNAGQSVTISNGASITANSAGSGNAGDVTIQGFTSPAQSVLINGAGSGIFTDTHGTGVGGDIHLSANSVTVQNSGTLSAVTSGTAASSTGGTITVEAPNAVTMTTGGTITASSTGHGNTGNIQINAGNQFSMTNSTVTTEANQSGGGAIKITTNPNGTIQLTDSTISASVLDGTGGGGSVNIDPQYVVLQNSQILANAVFGPGGNINITTNLLLPDNASVISASSQFGQQGTIVIQSPISPASGKIIPLGQKPLLPTSLLSQRCAALAGGNASSFTVAGRDALPVEPGGWLSSPLALTTAELVGSTTVEPESRTSLRESTEPMPVVSIRRIAPPGFLSQSFAADGTTGCTS